MLESPTQKLVENYIEKFNNDERYYQKDQAIIKLLKVFPENQKLEDILLKISVINDFYSTNIYRIFKMGKHIQQQNIDKGLNKGDPAIVNKIAKGHDIRTKKNNKEINFYSFATKYCNWHNKNDYAMYDSFVEKTLVAYKRKDRFSRFNKSELRKFKRFKQIIEDFVEFYELKKYNLKEIDKFLWFYGRETFS